MGNNTKVEAHEKIEEQKAAPLRPGNCQARGNPYREGEALSHDPVQLDPHDQSTRSAKERTKSRKVTGGAYGGHGHR